MLTDRYGLALSTASPIAQAAYIEGADLLLTVYPGAAAALDRAIAADPGFALAHVARGRACQMAGDIAGMQACLAAADASSADLPHRDRSHIEVFRRLFAGQNPAALAAIRSHVQSWPRDALILSLAANQGGLIGMSGLAGREVDLALFLDELAPHYGDDWWFNGHRGMALSEIGQHAAARPMIENSLAAYPRNAYGAHAFAHLCYETGDAEAGIAFLRGWLPDYDRNGSLFGHLSWHLGMFELAVGNINAGFELYTAAFSADDHRGAVHQKLSDSVAFLWRSELAGHARDEARWKKIQDYARAKFPRPSMSLIDWHVALTHAATGDDAAFDAWVSAVEDRVAAGTYPSGNNVPTIARAFQAYRKGDYATVIERIESMLPERERVGGSRAQVDLIEFTLLRAYLSANRPDDASRLLAARRPGPGRGPVEGAAAVH